MNKHPFTKAAKKTAKNRAEINKMLLHYEELDGFDLDVELKASDISNFLIERQFKRSSESLKKGSDFAFRIIGSAFEDCIKELDQRFDITVFLGWYEIVQDSEDFYNFEKDRHRKEAVAQSEILRR